MFLDREAGMWDNRDQLEKTMQVTIGENKVTIEGVDGQTVIVTISGKFKVVTGGDVNINYPEKVVITTSWIDTEEYDLD
jgi:translation initiation factor IF-1